MVANIPGRNSFAHNQINKIYPARSTSFSSESPTPLNLDYNSVSSLQGKGGEYESYLKQETYTKFPQQQQQKSTLLTDNAKNNIYVYNQNEYRIIRKKDEKTSKWAVI